KELMNPDGGFYSALDADSEGEEGKFYTWQYEEIRKLSGNDAEIFCEFFDITEKGNLPAEPAQASAGKAGQAGLEEKNILHVGKSPELFAREKNISVDELKNIIRRNKSILLAERNKRVRPLLDDKIILSW